MRIILHPGAHGAGDARLAAWLDLNRSALAKYGIAAWTPARLRDGMLAGLLCPADRTCPMGARRARRSIGRIALALAALERAGMHSLIVTEPRLIGSRRTNLAARSLYPGLSARLARLGRAFGGHALTVALGIRGYEDYWTEALARGLQGGRPMPDAQLLDHLTTQPRRWRTLVTRFATALPEARLQVWTSERHGERPAHLVETLLGHLPAGLAAVPDRQPEGLSLGALHALMAWRGQSLPRFADPAAPWAPFGADRAAVLRAEYRRDLAWLRAGADGLASYIDGPERPAIRPDRARMQTAGDIPPVTAIGGRRHGDQEGLAGPGRQGTARPFAG